MDQQMKGLQLTSSHEEILIKEIRQPVAGFDVSYRLYERAARFSIEISLDADRRRADVGKSFSNAAYLYELLVQGEVTPCTMQDILQDCALAQNLAISFH